MRPKLETVLQGFTVFTTDMLAAVGAVEAAVDVDAVHPLYMKVCVCCGCLCVRTLSCGTVFLYTITRFAYQCIHEHQCKAHASKCLLYMHMPHNACTITLDQGVPLLSSDWGGPPLLGSRGHWGNLYHSLLYCSTGISTLRAKGQHERVWCCFQ